MAELIHSVRRRVLGAPVPPGDFWRAVTVDALAGGRIRLFCESLEFAERLPVSEANEVLDGILDGRIVGVSMLGCVAERPLPRTLSRLRAEAVSADPRSNWEPWRLQHLPGAILAAARSRRTDEVAPLIERTLSELHSAIASAPGSDVPMEVGLRIVSLCLTADLAAAAGIESSLINGEAMRMALARQMVMLRDHWEWRPRIRGNHYLTNIVGLIWGSVYLNLDDSAIAPLCEALHTETARQILPDGGSFEGTSSYLRLSLQLIAASLLLLERRRVVVGTSSPEGVPSLPEIVLRRLRCARELLLALDAGGGRLIQVGDNDSGSCAALMIPKLEPLASRSQRAESLATLECLDLIGGLIASPPRDPGIMSVRDVFAISPTTLPHLHPLPISRGVSFGPPGADPDQEIVYRLVTDPGDAGMSAQASLYDDFGLWVYRDTAVHVVFRTHATGNGVTDAWHSHSDILSLQVFVLGRPFLEDCGTFVYIGNTDGRDLFRSSTAHSGPFWPEDPTRVRDGGSFRWISSVRGCVTNSSINSCSAMMTGPWGTVTRDVSIFSGFLEITDRLWRSPGARNAALTGILRPAVPVSPTYGELS